MIWDTSQLNNLCPLGNARLTWSEAPLCTFLRVHGARHFLVLGHFEADTTSLNSLTG